jgi:hypothetical protein
MEAPTGYRGGQSYGVEPAMVLAIIISKYDHIQELLHINQSVHATPKYQALQSVQMSVHVSKKALAVIQASLRLSNCQFGYI